MSQAERLYNAAYNAGNGARLSRINNIRYRYQDNIFRGSRSVAIGNQVPRNVYMGLANSNG